MSRIDEMFPEANWRDIAQIANGNVGLFHGVGQLSSEYAVLLSTERVITGHDGKTFGSDYETAKRFADNIGARLLRREVIKSSFFLDDEPPTWWNETIIVKNSDDEDPCT